MLTVLRKIRRSLIESSAFRRYLLYAIGEIALVVIGILIALQINNWNEHRKSLKLEQSYYCKILEDITQDSIQIERLIVGSDSRVKSANQLLHQLQQSEISRDEVIVALMGTLTLIQSTFTPSQAAFEDLKSSGNLNLLRDAGLKESIIDYYQTLNGLVEVADSHADEAIRTLNEKTDYAAIGWQNIRFVKEAMDTALVDMEKLKDLALPDEIYRKVMTSDGLLYLGANARIKYMYSLIREEIKEIQDKMRAKCRLNYR